MQLSRDAICSALIILLTSLVGCDSSGRVSVSGTVTFDDRPLGTGTVWFHPIGDGPSGYANVQSDGSYSVRTGSGKGLAPGEYRVAVQATGPIPAPTPDNPEPLPESLIPAKFASPRTSGLKVTVPASGGHFDLELQRD